MISDFAKQKLLGFQKSEITEYHIYTKLAELQKDAHNKDVLLRIAEDEKRHYGIWKEYTDTDVKPNMRKVKWMVFLCRILGLTFVIKLMERGESGAQDSYQQQKLLEEVPRAKVIAEEENAHENKLIEMLDEELLRYTGSVVLGLNDALVELTGALAGFTLALQNTKLIALTGLITGIAASFSMAASEYLATKTENDGKHPVKASVYTGIAYVCTVTLLILPYLLLSNYFVCLGLALVAAVLIIAFFNYYITVAQGGSFKARFLEMTGLSFGVAGLTFLIGYILRHFFDLEI